MEQTDTGTYRCLLRDAKTMDILDLSLVDILFRDAVHILDVAYSFVSLSPSPMLTLLCSYDQHTQMDTCGTRTSPYSRQGAYSNPGRTWGPQAGDGPLPGLSYSPAVLSSNVAQLAGRPASEGILQLATALTANGIQIIAVHFAMGDVAIFAIDDDGDMDLRWRVRGSLRN
jgi:hypothetical protein